MVSAANGDVRADELLSQTANATLRVNAQAIKEINSGQGQVINVAK
ncbi:hypothetical protein [Spirosoma foliorum]|uniref:Uncharacterized protein n=1 Tax=Spirosoma foliorum TaxID=2710596 RepID=A0A7G5H3U4_9BACT|nr:hypothetical protein [Spirosoma foliorum]QMW05786.1 hypothetical protein H3H32_13270 [Spirosoma foliorum]